MEILEPKNNNNNNKTTTTPQWISSVAEWERQKKDSANLKINQ